MLLRQPPGTGDRGAAAWGGGPGLAVLAGRGAGDTRLPPPPPPDSTLERGLILGPLSSPLSVHNQIKQHTHNNTCVDEGNKSVTGYHLITGSEIQSDLRFEICDPNYLLIHVLIALAASEATTASKQPWRSNLTSDLKSVTPITYLSMCRINSTS